MDGLRAVSDEKDKGMPYLTLSAPGSFCNKEGQQQSSMAKTSVVRWEFPCRRCKNEGRVCTVAMRKKTEYKKLPRGYMLPLSFGSFFSSHKMPSFY